MKDQVKQAADLAFVTTEELVAELRARSIAMALMLIPKSEPDMILQRFEGGRMTCLGMVEQTRFDILRQSECRRDRKVEPDGEQEDHDEDDEDGD